MKPKVLPKWVITLFFIIGMVSAICFRSLIIFNYYFTWMGRIVWYIGVIGYIFFFGYRFFISRKRRKIILENDLIKSVEKSSLSELEKEEVQYILNSIVKSKEMFNYVFIFFLSGFAILVDQVLMFISRG